MPTLETFLRRVRFPGVPGAPSAAGVPVDRAARIASELEPVLAALDGPQHRARQLVAEAEERAEGRRADTAAEVARIISAARLSAPAERARTAGAVTARAQRERARLLEAARHDADRIDRRTARLVPALAAAVVDGVLGLGRQDR